MAGAKTPQRQTIAAMEKAIREAGRDPMQRNTFYERIGSTMPVRASHGHADPVPAVLPV
jgi:aminodeoxyfutalosine synthase